MSRPEVGARVCLLAMPGDPDPIPFGTKGTVTGGSDGFGPSSQQVWVRWDNGRSLNLIPGIDVFEVIS